MESMTLVFLRQGTNNKIKRRRKTKKLQIQRISKNKPNKIRLSKNKPNKIRLSKNKPNKIWLSKSKNRFNSGKRGKKKEQNLDKHKSINPFTARPNNNL
jgi:hypothetical protein